jgi:hypothetical protein
VKWVRARSPPEALAELWSVCRRLFSRTSEGNNLVSSGIDLKVEQVLLFSDNHPSTDAWKTKARRFGLRYIIEQTNPHPDTYYLRP